MAMITPDLVNPQGQIDPKTIHSPSDVDNSAALQICVQDAKNTESWQNTNYWGIRWREADALYQSPPGVLFWEGSTTPRANNNRYVVAETVNTIHEQIMNGLFYEMPSFILRPRPNTTQDTTRAISALIALQLEDINLRQEVDWGIHSCLLFGTGIWKWGYENFTRKVTRYERVAQELLVQGPQPQPANHIATEDSMEFEEVDDEEEVFRPTFENRDIRYVLVDSGCAVSDIRKAKFVIDRMFLTYRDLEKLADEEYIYKDPKTGKKKLKKRYNLPSKEEIRSWFEPPREEVAQPDPTVATDVQNTSVIHHAMPRFRKTTEDPLNEPLEVLERWDNDKVITVIQRVKCIRNEPNEYKCIPFLSCNWWPIPNAFWGLGLGRVIGTEQRIQAGLINACLDLANLIVNPMFIRSKGANIETQQIRQRIGGIITADGPNPDRALTIVEQPPIPNEILQQIALSESRVEKASGASQAFTSGATTSRAGAARSGTGAAAMINATMSRIGATAEVFSRQVFEPLLYKIHELNKRKTPMGYVRKLLGAKMGDDYQKFNPQDFMDAPAVFEVLAGSHLAAKAQMAQSLFMMIQLFESPQLLAQLTDIGGKVVDVEELFKMVHDISGWKNYYNIVRPMTPEEQQRQQQKAEMNSPMAKAQAQQQVMQQQQQNKSALIDQENESRIVRDMFRDIAKRSAEPELLSGAPPTEGVGSQEVG